MQNIGSSQIRSLNIMCMIDACCRYVWFWVLRGMLCIYIYIYIYIYAHTFIRTYFSHIAWVQLWMTCTLTTLWWRLALQMKWPNCKDIRYLSIYASITLKIILRIFLGLARSCLRTCMHVHIYVYLHLPVYVYTCIYIIVKYYQCSHQKWNNWGRVMYTRPNS